MKKFESKISVAAAIHFARNFILFLILYFSLRIFFGIDLWGLERKYIVLWIGLYGLYTYIYLGLTNHDIIVGEETIAITNRIPLFRKKKIFYTKEIKSVVFRHDWTETLRFQVIPLWLGFIIQQYVLQTVFPPDYKWIKIVSDDSYTYYCFGIEVDSYINESEVFEGLFHTLAEKGLNVTWTNVTDSYYAGLMKRVWNKNMDD